MLPNEQEVLNRIREVSIQMGIELAIKYQRELTEQECEAITDMATVMVALEYAIKDFKKDLKHSKNDDEKHR